MIKANKHLFLTLLVLISLTILTITSSYTEEEIQTNIEIQSNLSKEEPQARIPYVYGTGTSSFYPNKHISRQEALVLFLRVFEIMETSSDPSVYPIEKLYQQLQNRSIRISDYQKNNLNDGISRAEVASIVNEYLQLSPIEVEVSANDIYHHLERDGIENVLSHSLMSVYNDGGFHPNKKVTRAELIVLLNRIQNRKTYNSNLESIPQIYKDVTSSHWAYADILESTTRHTVKYSEYGWEWLDYELTDSDNRKTEETKEYNKLKSILTKHGISNPNEKQIEAIKKMNEYISKNTQVKRDFNNNQTIVFAFEGAGDYKDNWSKTAYHTNGRYGAMFIVVRNKEVVYITTNASTLPDNPSDKINIRGQMKNIRTLDSQRENISYYYSGNHNGQYPALRPYNKSQKVKSLEGRADDGFYMNIHAGRSEQKRMSEGCLTIRHNDYIAFGKKVGFMPNSISDNISNFDSIENIGAGRYVRNVKVTLVLDRTLMDNEVKSQFWKQ